ncbi:MAG: ComEA family DNA-binding protein [Spongiibacteraceae bacterium]
MDQALSVVSFPRNSHLLSSRPLTKPLRALVVALAVGISANAWCAPEVAPKTPVAKSAAQKMGGVININTADAAALAELNGIGPAKATAIVDYRKQHGPFKSVEQLADVKGIGEAFIEKNRDRISVR